MATHTLATSGNLTAVKFSYDTTVLLPADLATIAQAIKNDLNQIGVPGAFVREGQLFIPRRSGGQVKVHPGDVVAVDNQGWPILISAYSIAHAQWTYT